MVKTRHQSSIDDGAKSTERKAAINSVKQVPVPLHPIADSDSEDEVYSRKKEKLPQRRKAPEDDVPSGRTQEKGMTNGRHDSSSEDEGNGEEDDSAVRRSTRRRKCIYGNLNQSWILTSNLPDFVKMNTTRSSRSKKESSVEPEFSDPPARRLRRHASPVVPVGNDSETRDGDNEDSMESKRSQEKTNGELQKLGLPQMPDEDLEDMYSRVKRSRQQRTSAAGEERRFFRPRRGGAQEDGAQEKGRATTVSSEEGEEGATETVDTEEEIGTGPQGYHLRPKRPVTNRFQFPVVETKRSKRIASIFHSPQCSRPPHSGHFRSPAHRSPMYHRKRHATHNSSSTSSSSDDDRRFEHRKARSMARARNRCLPVNFKEEDLLRGVLRDRAKIGSSLADVDPMQVDKEVMFDSVGGLDEHIRRLKEMILFPLIYPEVFEKFKITPPRGVLFYGPPGTGKTLVARALANECSTGDKRVAFFMRKGADCLSKWVGESERQLRLLFDQAYSMRPSIVFFDEIDGLAPVRSTRQDQIHSSIVSTLLALMDGLDSRGEVVVIGATNRVDAIDPALRRPGRFDREFHFALPCYEARLRILQIHTREWNPAPDPGVLSRLAARCAGYCGADLKALCAEAALVALRRCFPQIYDSKLKLQLDVDSVQILPEDYERAAQKIVPAAQRSAASPARPLTTFVRPLLCAAVENALEHLKAAFASGLRKSSVVSAVEGEDSTDDNLGFSGNEDPSVEAEAQRQNDVRKRAVTIPSVRPQFLGGRASHRPRLLVCGRPGMGQTTHVAPAVVHLLEHLPLHRLDLPALYAVTARAPEEACAQVLHEAQRVVPSVVYVPHLCRWWETVGETVRATFLTLLHDLGPWTPVFLLSTSDVPFDDLPLEVQQLFGSREVLELGPPSEAERREFFAALLRRGVERRPRPRIKSPGSRPQLPPAPPPEPRKLSPSEVERLRQQEEATLRELRLFLRDILGKLMRDRRYAMFAKPVDSAEVPDYREVIHDPMDLETMRSKIDLHQYQTVAQFLKDIDLICSNALEYNPDRDPMDKNIRHRACALRDAAYALVDSELDWEFEKICQDIVQARKDRGEDPMQHAPNQYHTPLQRRRVSVEEVHGDPGDETGPKRCSRRIRGLGSEPESRVEAKKNEVRTEPTKSASHAGGCQDGTDGEETHYIVLRRRKSPWFGCGTRRIVRVLAAGTAARGPSASDQQCPSSSAEDASRAKRPRLPSTTDEDWCIVTRKDEEAAVTTQGRSEGQGEGQRTAAGRADSPVEHQQTSKAVEDVGIVAAANAAPDRVDPTEREPIPKEVERKEEEEKVRELKLDRRRLEGILELVVKATENCSVETLERLHCALLNTIQRHRRNWDRTQMLDELEQEVGRFQGLP